MQSGRRTDFDAVVIGGGPAGSLVARGLALTGWRTILIERGPRYRNKTCGHCLNPRGLRILDDHGLLEAVRAIAVGSTGHLRMHAPGGRPLTTPLSDRPDEQPSEVGLLTPRHILDQVLIDAAQNAGVEVLQPASARLHQAAEGELAVSVHHPHFRGYIRAGLVVGADGLGSTVARAGGLCDGAVIGRKFGFSFDIQTQCRDQSNSVGQHVEMMVMPDGYLGVVCQTDGVAHCAGLVASHSSAASREPLEFARRGLQQLGAWQRFGMGEVDPQRVSHFAATGPMPWRPAFVANAQVALVGDAAGYIEPFTGEGMAWALHSASLLLNTLSGRQPGCWVRALAHQYQREWNRHIGTRQRACRAVAFALARPRLFSVALGVARRHPILPRRIVKWVHA